jgi:ATP-dependent Clp protease ATP-binding subunit ClpA
VFDRSDTATREIIDAAVDESRSRHHNWVGTEHLLLAFARRPDLLPADVAELLPDADAVGSALASASGPGRPDAELLKTVGVDLDAVRSAVRRTFGEEGVRRLRRPVHQPWQPWRRPSRRCTSLLVGELSVAPRAKQALDRAREHAERRQLPAIDPVGLLLGMVEVEGAMSNRLLRDLGVEPDTLRVVLARHARRPA